MNYVHRASAAGGIIGGALHSPKAVLENKIRQINSQGQELVWVLPDAFNFFLVLVQLLCLIVTLLMWCPAPGYLIVSKDSHGMPTMQTPVNRPRKEPDISFH